MSISMLGRWVFEPSVPPPPKAIVETVERRLDVRPQHLALPVRHGVWTGSHLCFGAALGVVAAVLPFRPRPPLYGAAVWLCNYGIMLPLLRLYPPVWKDDRTRAIETFLSHLVYDAALQLER
jgi:hypothetical protein